MEIIWQDSVILALLVAIISRLCYSNGYNNGRSDEAYWNEQRRIENTGNYFTLRGGKNGHKYEYPPTPRGINNEIK